MFRFTIRELVLMTIIAAMGVAWWLDRSQIANELAVYRRSRAAEDALQAAEDKLSAERKKYFEFLRSSVPAGDRLRPVPGDKDYQFPPNFPLHYDYEKSN